MNFPSCAHKIADIHSLIAIIASIGDGWLGVRSVFKAVRAPLVYLAPTTIWSRTGRGTR